MANAKLSDVELKIGLVASLENSKKLGPNNGANNNYQGRGLIITITLAPRGEKTLAPRGGKRAQTKGA